MVACIGLASTTIHLAHLQSSVYALKYTLVCLNLYIDFISALQDLASLVSRESVLPPVIKL